MGDASVLEIVRRGWWRYDGRVERLVDVVGLAYDFWFMVAEADEQLEPGQLPMEPDENGLLYYVRFRCAGDLSTPTWPDSGGSADIEAAVRTAEERAPLPIRWESSSP